MTLTNLGTLTGSIGKRGAGMLPHCGQNNVQGNTDDPDVLARVK
jgi:predicted molibdopterin-dependent oxidoreductase YjgC